MVTSRREPRILIAPDKFKGSLSAREASDAIAAGIRDVWPDARLRLIPIADGGEGTVDAVVWAGAQPRSVRVAGPLGHPVSARYAVRGRTAVIEAAQAAGLMLLTPASATARTASTRGVGELILDALEEGCAEVVLAVGGTATTDGGAGMALAVGARLLDASGTEVPPGGEGLLALDRIDVTDMDRRIAGALVVVACDVDNPLVGADGAAAVFSPQKGADADDVALLARALERYAQVIRRCLGVDVADRPGAGAAGGLAAGAVVFLGAELTSGSELMMTLLDIPAALASVDLVITGEGSLDRQSLRGKGPGHLARSARRRGIPVYALAGRVSLDAGELDETGITRAWSLTDLEHRPGQAMAQAARLLRARPRAAALHWAAGR